MKKHNILKNIFKKALSTDDLIIVCGNVLCKEALYYDDNRLLYLGSELDISLVVGLAMCTDKRVVLICSDSDLLSNLDAFSQIVLSKLSNLFCVILKSDYNEEIDWPSLETGLLSIKGVLFNMGFTVHDYSHFFNSTPNKNIKMYFDRVRGPMCVLIGASKGLNKNTVDFVLSTEDNISRLRLFMNSF